MWYWDGTNWQEIPNITEAFRLCQQILTLTMAEFFINADAGVVDIQGAGGLTVAGQTASNFNSDQFQIECIGK